MRQPFVAGNWKLNGSKKENTQLIEGLLGQISCVTTAEVVVCPPAIYIPQISELLKDTVITYGSQNICEQPSGAYTGEMSASMLKEFGCSYALVGHSERRSIYGESSDLVADKAIAAIEGGVTPILCVGELLEERESGKTESVIEQQLDAVLAKGGVELIEKLIIAYEPVWAIGTGKTASPQQAQDVHAFIRGKLSALDASVADKVRILYGGSVKPGNAEELFAKDDIDGGLIGGASLDAQSFIAICAAANK